MLNKNQGEEKIDSTLNLDVYGLKLQLQSGDHSVVGSIRREFSYFQVVPSQPQVTIEVFDEKPPYEYLPNLPASFHTPRNICYKGKEELYIDYFGRALEIFNPKTKNCRIFSESPELRREISYLSILSIVGQFLDSHHIHRVHALGLSRNGKAILILLPMGGGKSTLALQLLQSGQVKLLSDDSPLLTPSGRVLPFPLGLGVRPEEKLNLPARYLYKVDRMHFGPKVLIDIDYFTGKISPICESSVILLGERSLGIEPKIEPASKLAATRAFFKDAVIGLGLFEGAEYVLQRSTWEIVGKTGIVLSRLNTSLKVIGRSQVYRYILGRDRTRNRDVFLDFLHRLNL